MKSTLRSVIRGLSVATVVLLSSPGAVRGQDVALTMSALTPMTVDYTDGVQAVQNVVPIGQLPDSGNVQAAIAGSGFARVGWYRYVHRGYIEQMLEANAWAGPQGVGACGPFEVLYELNAASPRSVDLQFLRYDSISAGQPWSTLSIDVDNDGTIDYVVGAGMGFTLAGLQIDAGPRVLRVVMGSVAIGPGQAAVGMMVRVVPDNDLLVLPEALGCPFPGTMFPPTPVFVDQGFDLVFSPGLLVVGAAVAPTVWTPASVLPFASTCLLLPSPDIVLWVPSGFLHVPVPAALRPLELHVQAVCPGPTGFTATDAFVIHAQ